jgi:hypothetical protein
MAQGPPLEPYDDNLTGAVDMIVNHSKTAVEVLTTFPSLLDLFTDLTALQHAVATPSAITPVADGAVTLEEYTAAVTAVLDSFDVKFVLQENPKLLPYTESLLRLSKYVRLRDYPQ